MNRDAMPRIALHCLSLALAGLLVACGAPAKRAPGPSPDGADLRSADIGGPFALVDKTGRTWRWSDFAGKYRVVYFGYTYCPDVCPTDMQRTIQGLTIYAKDHPDAFARIQPIFVTVDPERDTGAVVGEFAAAFSPHVLGLTGSPEAVRAAMTAFKVYAEKGAPQPGGGYLVQHTNITYLFDPSGKPLGTLPTDKGAKAVAAELASWMP